MAYRILQNGNLRHFLSTEAAGGVVLLAAAVLALIIVNTPVAGIYHLVFSEWHVTHWINDGLMTLFFFVVGLEIKREFVHGSLADARQALLPVLAALGGMVVPALIFYAINRDVPENLNGWAIPTATDIAFSLGLLAMIGRNAPTGLKTLLMAIAIIDDLAAIVIIAFFYTKSIDISSLVIALGALIILILFNLLKIRQWWLYILAGVLMWAALLTSGIHPTLAGVATAFLIPSIPMAGRDYSLSDRLINFLHPYVAFIILPLFALANAGISFAGLTSQDLVSHLTLSIILGLTVGKTIGIAGMIALAYWIGIVSRPVDFRSRHIIGLGFICGIGLTMSLFIGELAFHMEELQIQVKIGILCGSLLSAIMAYILLSRPGPPDQRSSKT